LGSGWTREATSFNPTQFQFSHRFGDGREFLFQWQAIERPEMGLTGIVEYRDRLVTIELDFEDPMRRIERRFGTFRHHRRHEIREDLLWHADRGQETRIPLPGQLNRPSTTLLC